MTEPHEVLDDRALVKGTMLRAHLSWAARHTDNDLAAVRRSLSPAALELLSRSVLPTDWIPFRLLIEIDKAIAAAAGGPPEAVYRELGRHSAALNLSGVYKAFIGDEPHRFFEKMTILHHQFQSFGRSAYEKRSERSGRIRLEGYSVFSPSFCAAGRGYYEEALRLMRVPGPIDVRETSCCCLGAESCVFDLSW